MDVNSPVSPLSRRSLLLSGLSSAALLAVSCTSSTRATRSSALPSPVWPHERTPGPDPRPASRLDPSAGPLRRVSVIPRSNWTSAQTRLAETNPMAGIARITVHHDGMDPVSLGSPAEVAQRLERIRQVHVDNNGWADIGYHFAIDPAGRVWAARPLDRQGAHVRDQNEHNMGILVLGNFEVQSPTPAATAALDALLVEAALVNRVPLGNIRTHREWNPTACPGASLQDHMNRARSRGGRVAQNMA